MKICVIGDPHGNVEELKKIPLKGVDLILLTGDLGRSDLLRKVAFREEKKNKTKEDIKKENKEEIHAILEAYKTTMRVINYLRKFAPIITIYGNVEIPNNVIRQISKRLNYPLPLLLNELKKFENVRVLNNKIANVNGIRIGGLQYFVEEAWVREFKPKNYKERLKHAKKETQKAKKVLKNFNELDILLCHQPPYGILDKVTSKYGAPKAWYGRSAGSKTILKYTLEKKPRYVFCGHIHEGEGHKKVNTTNIYNVGTCKYKIIEIEKNKKKINS